MALPCPLTNTVPVTLQGLHFSSHLGPTSVIICVPAESLSLLSTLGQQGSQAVVLCFQPLPCTKHAHTKMRWSQSPHYYNHPILNPHQRSIPQMTYCESQCTHISYLLNQSPRLLFLLSCTKEWLQFESCHYSIAAFISKGRFLHERVATIREWPLWVTFIPQVNTTQGK